MVPRYLTIALSLLLLAAIPASAERIAPPTSGDIEVPERGGPCPTSGYKDFSVTLSPAAPVGSTAPIVTVVIPTGTPGTCFDDVIFFVEMDHTWVGDLIVELTYDVECDGVGDIGPVSAICRPGTSLGCPPGPLPPGDDGCDSDLDGVYMFSDAGGVALADPGCLGDAAIMPPGCYGLAPESASGLDIFDGVAKGGCFAIDIKDGNPAFDDGVVYAAGVFTSNTGCAVPTIDSTWGRVKATFQE